MSKIAFITGSRRGIGLGIAQTLSSSGYTIVLSGTSSAAENIDILQQFPNGMYVQLNISCGEDRQKALDQILATYGRIDVLVNNAGIAPKVRQDILETTQESFDEVMDVNLSGSFFMCQLFASAMLTLKTKNLMDYQPKIINISSLSAYTASLNRGEYCISKAGLSMVTDLFAVRLANEGIGVFEVQPGIIETDMTSGVKEKYEDLIANGLTPIRRLGQPQDIAKAVLALCSGQLDFAPGQKLQVDGGFHIRTL